VAPSGQQMEPAMPATEFDHLLDDEPPVTPVRPRRR
jgi:hypothetical protein